jgi:hypothetical protein
MLTSWRRPYKRELAAHVAGSQPTQKRDVQHVRDVTAPLCTRSIGAYHHTLLVQYIYSEGACAGARRTVRGTHVAVSLPQLQRVSSVTRIALETLRTKGARNSVQSGMGQGTLRYADPANVRILYLAGCPEPRGIRTQGR